MVYGGWGIIQLATQSYKWFSAKQSYFWCADEGFLCILPSPHRIYNTNTQDDKLEWGRGNEREPGNFG